MKPDDRGAWCASRCTARRCPPTCSTCAGGTSKLDPACLELTLARGLVENARRISAQARQPASKSRAGSGVPSVLCALAMRVQ